VTSALWDRLVFSKIAAKLGARVRLIISGSAPISADVKDFLRMYPPRPPTCGHHVHSRSMTVDTLRLTLYLIPQLFLGRPS
jgi:hypothetical protein